MTVAAFILSIVAILVAAVSAWYTRRQAVSGEGLRKIEAARRHDELRPALAGKYVPARNTQGGQRPGVKLTNQGLIDLDRIDVRVIPVQQEHEAALEGIYDHQTGGIVLRQEIGRLPRGESWTLEVLPARHSVGIGHKLDRGGTVQFRCTCHAASYEPWEVIVSVTFPKTTRVFVV